MPVNIFPLVVFDFGASRISIIFIKYSIKLVLKFRQIFVSYLGDLELTVDKILQTLKWRRINHVDELLTFKESELGKIMAPIFLGLNYPLCSPVWYLPLGRIDFKGKIHDLSETKVDFR